MSIRTWIRALHLRNRDVQRLMKVLDDVLESQHRLEIDQRKLRDHFTLLDAQQEKLAGRLDGRRGGRPPLNAPKRLEDIPVGDKAALRAAMGVVPGRRFNHEE